MIESTSGDLRFAALPVVARIYIVCVVAAGAVTAATFLPTQISRPVLFGVLLVIGYLTSTWKVNLPLPLANGATLSVSYAADLMSFLVLGPQQAMVVAMTGAWAQCARQAKRNYPLYRTIFSVAAVVLTMRVVAVTYAWLNGAAAPTSLTYMATPLMAVIAVYFAINTALIAIVIALATHEPPWTVWRENFLWSAPSFIVAGFAGALAAIVVTHGDFWLAVLLVVPIYVTYRSYHVFLGRMEHEHRHASQAREHRHAVNATDTAGLEERMKASELESLGLLAAGIAHNFNNVLAAILGNVSLARRAELDDVTEDALAAAEEACMRARQMTQQLRTFANGGPAVKKPVRVERVIMESIRMALSGATVSWIADIDPAVGTVDADEGQLIQVLNNVIINAKQATPHGGRISVTAVNVSEPEERWEFGLRVRAVPYVRVSVADEGAGISPGDFPRIFDPYFTTKPAGTGLGLATSRSIVKNHGGYIAVESEPGRGTSVHICLPVWLAARRDQQPAASQTRG